MRSAAFLAAGIVAIGAYLALAAALALSPTWIGLGALSIAVLVGIAMVATGDGTATVRA
jgi:hypothetical protein